VAEAMYNAPRRTTIALHMMCAFNGTPRRALTLAHVEENGNALSRANDHIFHQLHHESEYHSRLPSMNTDETEKSCAKEHTLQENRTSRILKRLIV
jgi:hypothetical protein